MSNKIFIKSPIVELDGEGQARIFSQEIKNKVINHFLDIKIKYFDLSTENIELTTGKVSTEAEEVVEREVACFRCPSSNSVSLLSILRLWIEALNMIAIHDKNKELENFCNRLKEEVNAFNDNAINSLDELLLKL
ncbi:isocitrate dehydrogenase [Bacteriovorax sp. Seq25_V]|uniref:isocitrate dehydrogenase n=1 Tax=Bacteriovorax sp. Seq25_V TaxID=1201288 RepID=UPI00038A309F|nr:isocitrate dehydrogenase [Bacteriovorax sp. Seq25_V]EQC47601.1 isocitrate dehydrogenase family protein [Bacteriovorax sp. Seq25_V]